MCKLSIFTATYNRAYILPKLYESLCRQSCFDFEWILIDDGSSDNTVSMIQQWKKKEKPFKIKFIQTKHGGKIRALNKAVSIAQGDFFLIVDSDDYLKEFAVEWIFSVIPLINDNPSFAGFSGIRCKSNDDYIRKPDFNGAAYIDCLNTERLKYKLDADMAEVYKTSILRKYPFPECDGETYIPENVVWDQIALDGYCLRWYDKKIYVCEYLEDGITKGWDTLRTKNPLGFAMSANTYLKYAQGIYFKLQLIGEILYCCYLKGDFSFLKKTVYPKIGYMLLPVGFFYYLFRRIRERKLYIQVFQKCILFFSRKKDC